MELVKVQVALGGDRGNTVPKTVTIAELVVLRAIHGEEAVFDIEPTQPRTPEEVELTETGNSGEIERLKSVYGGALFEGKSLVAQLFPGVGARVPTTLAALDLPEELYKAISRVTAKTVAEPAPKRARKAAEPEAEAPGVME